MPALLEDIETISGVGTSRSYRQYLTTRMPEAYALSDRFYQLIDQSRGGVLHASYSTCRTRAWFCRDAESGSVRVFTNQCRLRWCNFCGESRQQFITSQVLPWYEHAKDAKLMTLTVKHTKDALKPQIDFLYKSFNKLRKRKRFSSKVRGGVWFFQITYNQKSKEWHPHIHILLDADYIPHEYLMAAWSNITNGSTIVHIRRVHNPEHTLSHNARYAARPSSLSKIPESLWLELFESFHKRRICGTFGTARKISLRPKRPDDANNWKRVGSFSYVYSLLKDDEHARKIWDAWMFKSYLQENIDMSHVDESMSFPKTDIPPPPKWISEPMFIWD